MQIQLHHDIEIDAPADAVWRVIADTERYGDWNPFIRRLQGELSEGSKIEVEIAPPGGRAMTFRPTVLVVQPEREVRWLGRLLIPGLFDGEHRFQLEPLPDGRTRFIQSERFSGILVRLLGKALEPTRAGFDQMNRALKAEAEASNGLRRAS